MRPKETDERFGYKKYGFNLYSPHRFTQNLAFSKHYRYPITPEIYSIYEISLIDELDTVVTNGISYLRHNPERKITIECKDCCEDEKIMNLIIEEDLPIHEFRGSFLKIHNIKR